jgi:hypothetical protein
MEVVTTPWRAGANGGEQDGLDESDLRTALSPLTASALSA